MPNKEKQDWKEEFRGYFDKMLKPKKPTIKNLDREILVDFIKNTHTTLLQSVVKDLLEMKINKMPTGSFWNKISVSRCYISVEDIISYFKNKHGLDI